MSLSSFWSSVARQMRGLASAAEATPAALSSLTNAGTAAIGFAAIVAVTYVPLRTYWDVQTVRIKVDEHARLLDEQGVALRAILQELRSSRPAAAGRSAPPEAVAAKAL